MKITGNHLRSAFWAGSAVAMLLISSPASAQFWQPRDTGGQSGFTTPPAPEPSSSPAPLPASGKETPLNDITGTQDKHTIDDLQHHIDPAHYPAPPKVEEPKPEEPSWFDSCVSGVCSAVKFVVDPLGIIGKVIDVVDPKVDEAAEQKAHNARAHEEAKARENQQQSEHRSLEAPKTETQKAEMQKPELRKSAETPKMETPKIAPKRLDTKALNITKEGIAPKRVSLKASSNVPSANDRSAFKAEAANIVAGHVPAAAINLNAGKPLPAMSLSHLPAVSALNSLTVTNRLTALTAMKR